MLDELLSLFGVLLHSGAALLQGSLPLKVHSTLWSQAAALEVAICLGVAALATEGGEGVRRVDVSAASSCECCVVRSWRLFGGRSWRCLVEGTVYQKNSLLQFSSEGRGMKARPLQWKRHRCQQTGQESSAKWRRHLDPHHDGFDREGIDRTAGIARTHSPRCVHVFLVHISSVVRMWMFT